MATLPGVKLYGRRGYVGSERVRHDVGGGETIEFIPMRKRLDTPSSPSRIGLGRP
jgi:hypothetical protein